MFTEILDGSSTTSFFGVEGQDLKAPHTHCGLWYSQLCWLRFMQLITGEPEQHHSTSFTAETATTWATVKRKSTSIISDMFKNDTQ